MKILGPGIRGPVPLLLKGMSKIKEGAENKIRLVNSRVLYCRYSLSRVSHCQKTYMLNAETMNPLIFFSIIYFRYDSDYYFGYD